MKTAREAIATALNTWERDPLVDSLLAVFNEYRASREPGRDQTLEEAAREASGRACKSPCEHETCYGFRGAAAAIRGMKSRPQESPPREPGKCATWCGGPRAGVTPGEACWGYREEQVFCSQACIVGGRPSNPGDSAIPVDINPKGR